MRTINLPTDLLRTFVAVYDAGGYTKAGEIVGRTQPAVSLQMRRLEELFGAKLISQQGRNLKLTEAGELLVLYSRQILRLNDEAVAEFRQTDNGEINLGIPIDFAASYLQDVAMEFAEANPNFSLSIRCEQSGTLHTMLEKDELDIIVAVCPPRQRENLVRDWLEEVVWVTKKDCTKKEKMIPLVTHQEGCEYRQRMIHALNFSDRGWKIAFSSPEYLALQNAVEAGFGISATTNWAVTDKMRVLTAQDGFPQLEQLRVGLLYKHTRMSTPTLNLVESLVAALDNHCNSSTDMRKEIPLNS